MEENHNDQRRVNDYTFFWLLQQIGTILWNTFAVTVNFLFAPKGKQLQEINFLKNMYANMSDQELYREYQNIKCDLLKIKNLKKTQDARNTYMAFKSNIFVSTYILSKDFTSSIDLITLEREIERPKYYIEEELKKRYDRLPNNF